MTILTVSQAKTIAEDIARRARLSGDLVALYVIRGAVRFGSPHSSAAQSGAAIGTYDGKVTAAQVFADLEAAGVILQAPSGVLPVFPGRM